ncbi:phage tail tape measure protein [Agromyces sp. SYSU T00194]|uniref:phage tail tape measure protein n=1 Tax=Agromyces chitinivorans TaxID=3158560 RepID=UPI003390B361
MPASKSLIFDIVGRDRGAASALNDVSNKLLGVGAATVTGVGIAVKKFADFDQQMSLVQDGTRATTSEMDDLREAALQAGADTKYSATEAAAAIDALGRAGVATDDILSGGLTGALDLAAAGNLDVAQAAEIASVAMVQFKKTGEEVPHIADLLAAGAGKAMGSVEDLSMALNQSGLVASQAGLSIEETTGTLAAFASAGLAGSDGGTSFKTMLQRLNPVSAAARAKMDELGISAYDAQGNFIGMEQYAGVLRNALADLSPEARNAALNVMFGSDAVRAASVLYEQGADGIGEWITATDDAGYAAESAAIQMDNLSGDVELLGGSIETALIKQGSGANGVLRELTQTATGLVNGFAELPPGLQQNLTMLTLLGGSAAVVTGGALKLIPAIDRTRVSLRRLNATGSRSIKVLGKGAGLAGVLTGLVVGVSILDQIAHAGDAAAMGLEELGRAARRGDLDAGFADISSSVGDLDQALELMLGHSVDSEIERWADAVFGWSGVHGVVDETRTSFQNLGQVLAEMVSSGNVEQAERIFNQVAAAAAEQGFEVEQVKDLMPAYGEALAGAANEQDDMARSTDEATVNLAGLGDEATDTEQKVSDLEDQLRNFGSVTLDTRQAQRDFQQALADAADALEENGKTLDITTEAGRENQDALDDIAKSAADQAASIWASTESEEALQEALADSRADLIEAATQFGMSADEAEAYADKVLATPSEVMTTVKVAGITEARLAFDNLIAGYQNRSVTLRAVMEAADKLPGNAAGGAIYGPGPKGVDSVLRMLAPGEHVLTANEVDLMGGQSAVYAFRRQLATGAQMMGAPSVRAAGVPVGMSGAGQAQALSLEGLAISGTLQIGGDGLARIIDGRIVRANRDTRVSLENGRRS